MIASDLEKIAKSYELTVEDIKVSAIVHMLGTKNGSALNLPQILGKLEHIYDTASLCSIIKWATWVKEAKLKNMEGKDVFSLAKITGTPIDIA